MAAVVQAVTNAVANGETIAAIAGYSYRTDDVAPSGKLAGYIDEGGLSSSTDYVSASAYYASAGWTFNTGKPPVPIGGADNNTWYFVGINKIYVSLKQKCGVGKTEPASGKSAAVVVQLETGGNGKYYCQTAGG